MEWQDTAEALLDAVTDPLVVTADGRIVAANRAASILLGSDLLGRQLAALVPDEARAGLGGGGETPTLFSGLGGQRRHWEMRVGALAGGRRLVHLIDRTAIEAAERMRVDFVANASHELRTPIAAITGFVETLADDEAGGDAPTRARFLTIIAREVRRMQRLVEDLMSLSRIEADRHVVPSELVDFAATVREAASAAAEQRAPRGDDLVLGHFERDLKVLGDGAQLAQLAHNLVSNGFKYGEPGTPVTVTVERDGDFARLCVGDEGEGIAPQHLSRITQRFYRVDAKRSRAVGGTGLGLAIVKHVVERHAGTLDIQSAPGRGTTVRVRLPLADADMS